MATPKPPVALEPPTLPDHLDPNDISTPLLPTMLASLALSSNWKGIQTHTHSPLPPYAPLPRAMISGYPPVELYPEAHRKSRRREWVLPTSLAEKWTLRKWAEAFDAVGRYPPEIGEDGAVVEEAKVEENEKAKDAKKRMLMAVVGSDGTVVYYFVHDGVVKPRQN